MTMLATTTQQSNQFYDYDDYVTTDDCNDHATIASMFHLT